MYNCEMCGRTTEPGQPIIRHTVKTRNKDYPARRYKGGRRRMTDEDAERESGPRLVFDPGGFGREIAQEAKVCPDCGVKLQLGEVVFRPFKAAPKGPLTPKARKPKPAPIPEAITTHRIEAPI